MVSIPKSNPVFKASYFVKDRPANAGGFIRFNAIAGNEFKYLMMFHWGSNQHRADFLPRCIGYENNGVQQNWAYLQQLALNHQGFYWKIPDDPGIWHDLTVDIPDLYNAVTKKPRAFENLGITKLYIQIGTWTNRELDSGSSAYFDNIELFSGNNKTQSKVGDSFLPISDWAHLTDFGQELIDETGVPELRRLKVS